MAGSPEGLVPRRHQGPEIVAPTNRINVSLPFSSITIHQPDEQFTELVAIVVGLAALIEAGSPGPEIKELHERACALAAHTA